LTRRLVEERRRVDLKIRKEAPLLGRAGSPSPPLAEESPAGFRSTFQHDSGKSGMIFNRPMKPPEAVEPLVSSSLPRKAIDGELPPTVRTAPPIDMERITEHVIKQIDNRLIAHRERMGRPGV
jgi:hypothetical protein